VLISGGSSGIGKAIAESLARLGSNVVIFGRDKKRVDTAISEIDSDRIKGFSLDATDGESVKSIFSYIKDNYGRLDVLINNAAVPARSITDYDFKEIEYILKTNIAGYLYCANEAIKMMSKQKSGHIINIGSMSSSIQEEDADLYVLTKSAIEGFSNSIRKKVNQDGIKVSLIKPGSVATGMSSETFLQQKSSKQQELMLDPRDVAEAVIFCLNRSDGSEIISIEIKPLKQII
jgi:NADP-dependent 3-hydroxy acid dehydrogenase YdfG